MTRVHPKPHPSSATFFSTALALAAGFALLYLVTPTRHYTFDAVAYAYQIERFTQDGRPGWLFHAHHLLFNVAGWLVWAGMRELGVRVTTLEALQVLNAVMGGIGVGLFAWVLARATLRPTLAVAMALLMAVTHGYWTCATDGRVNLPGMVLVIGAFGAALRWQEAGTARWAVASGALTGLAVLLHQSHFLFVPVLGAAMLLCRVPWRRRLVTGLMAALALVLTVGVAYFAVAVAVKGVRDLPELQAWLWQYGADGRWWSLDWRANLPLSGAALARAALPIPGVAEGQALLLDLGLRLESRWAALPILLLLVGGGLLGIRAPVILRRHGAPLLLCLTWFAVYAGFFTIWNPGYFPFWLPPLAAAWFGVGFIVAGLLPAPAPSAGIEAETSLQGAHPVIGGFAAAQHRPLHSRGGSYSAALLGRQTPRAAAAERHVHLQRCLARRRAALRLARPGRRPASSPWRGSLLTSYSCSWGRGGSTRRIMRAERPRTQERPFALPRWFSAPALQRSMAGAGHLAALAPAVLVLGLLPVLFTHTYQLAIRPRMEAGTNPYLRMAETLQQTTRPGDLILATGAGWLAQGEVYVPYFSERPLLALQQVLKQQQGDRKASFDYLRRYMERCWKRGGQVYVLQEVLSSGPAYTVLRERYGLSQAEARQFFQAYAPRPALRAGPHSVWVLSDPARRYESADAGRALVRTGVMGVQQRLPRTQEPGSRNAIDRSVPRKSVWKTAGNAASTAGTLVR